MRRAQAVLDRQRSDGDDILDLVATDEQLGKPSGNDLREGVYTLPVIRMLADGHEVGQLLGGQLTDEQRNTARAMVVGGDHISTSIDTANSYVDQAVVALEGLPETPALTGLRSAATNLLSSLPS